MDAGYKAWEAYSLASEGALDQIRRAEDGGADTLSARAQ
jgi:hypothetical protein